MGNSDMQIKAQDVAQKHQREDLKMMLDQYRKMLEVQLDAQNRAKIANAKVNSMNAPRMPIPSLAQIQ
jgi:hypothetical protein